MKRSIQSSNKYAGSPELFLWIGDSPLGCSLTVILIGLETSAMSLLILRGYAGEAALLSLLAVALLRSLLRSRTPGVGLAWRSGNWMLLEGAASRPVRLLAAPVATPWMIFLVFADAPGARPSRLWIFRDSVSPLQWRRLRVRSALEPRGHCQSGSGR